MNEGSSSRPSEPAASWSDPPGLGKALAVGVSIGVTISFFGIGGAVLATGHGWGASLGLGAFVAVWGGLGFGGMLGGVMYVTRLEREAEQARVEARRPAAGTLESVDPAPEPVHRGDAAGSSSDSAPTKLAS